MSNTRVVLRGISIHAGGTVGPGAIRFELAVDAGPETYGICQNPFLHANFKVVRHVPKLTLHDDDSFDNEQDARLRIKDHPGLFHHTDNNYLKGIT